MITRKVLLERTGTPGTARITRQDFLKNGATGLAEAVMLGSSGCGVFQQGGQQGGDSAVQNAFSYGLGGEIPDMDRAMSLDRAARYALLKEEPALPRTPVPEEHSTDNPPVTLSPREKEVALLVAKELTNRQISSKLMLSEHTVATHIRNILKRS